MADFYDIDASFELNALGDINILEDQSALQQAIKSILYTDTGLRPGAGIQNQNYGVGINSYLFAPLTQFTAQSFSDAIYRHLTIFEPRINLENVSVTADKQDKLFDVEITYTIEGSTDKITFRTIINQI